MHPEPRIREDRPPGWWARRPRWQVAALRLAAVLALAASGCALVRGRRLRRCA